MKIFEGKHVVVLERDGWEFVERKRATKAAAVVAITDDHRLILTEQFRAPVNARVIDLPAGLIEEFGAEETARRELEEETGFTCERVIILATVATSPGITSEIVHLFGAINVKRKGKGGGVEGEDITVHEIPFADVGKWLQSQRTLVDTKVWAGLYFATQST